MFALIDGNNFYVSCERVFRPSLQGLPVVVFSDNDGCAIARSDEAKAMGIKMGQPYYQFRDLERVSRLVCLSANFELYGDTSDRMMSLAAGLGPLQEIYSIDESFIGDLDGIPDLTRRAWAIRARIDKWIGIPTCTGLALTKTLAITSPSGLNCAHKEHEKWLSTQLCGICLLFDQPTSEFVTNTIACAPNRLMSN